MQDLIDAIAAKQAEVERLRGLASGGLRNFEHSQDLELTYTSNAIEGNTLSAVETTLVIEHGITVAGKPLRDHLEALDLYEAIRYVRGLGRRAEPLLEMDVRSLHRLVVLRSHPDLAGRYADQGRYVPTASGRQAFPSPAEVPALMGDFAAWLGSAADTPATAFTAHRRLVQIHPFNDGNGRTARLLMNLILVRAGYPPVAVRPVDRPAYLDALRRRRTGLAPRHSTACCTSGWTGRWTRYLKPCGTRSPKSRPKPSASRACSDQAIAAPPDPCRRSRSPPARCRPISPRRSAA